MLEEDYVKVSAIDKSSNGMRSNIDVDDCDDGVAGCLSSFLISSPRGPQNTHFEHKQRFARFTANSLTPLIWRVTWPPPHYLRCC